MRAPILFLLGSLVLGSACGQSAASSVVQAPVPVVAAPIPGVEAQITLDVLELI